jgi:GT2 family glycosyltransferase
MELIIVNDGSTDETPAYLAALSDQHSWIKAVTQARGWQARARNRGIVLSSGELIAITDDDCTVAEDWLPSIAAVMEDQTISAIGGRAYAPGQSLVASYENYVRALDPMLLPDGTPRYLVTANACFRRQALMQVGLFGESFGAVGGEDTELSLRMSRQGMKLRFAPSCRVFHWYDPAIKRFVQAHYRAGYGTRQIFEKHLSWEHWLSAADRRLHMLLSSHTTWRSFQELANAELRPWYGVLHTLHTLAYLAGYLRLTQSAQFATLRPAEENAGQLSQHAPTDAETSTLRAECLAATWQALSTDLASQNASSDPSARSLPAWLERHSPLTPTALLNLLDLDLLLSIAIPDDLPVAQPGVADEALPEHLREEYKAHERSLQHECERLYEDLLHQLLRQPDGLSPLSIERACDARALNVNGFLTWYGRYLDKGGNAT